MAGKFNIIEHPADTGIEIEGDTLEELFEYAGQGFFATAVLHPSKIKPETEREIRVFGRDLQELMVNFLSEFLYFIDAEGLVFSKIKIFDIKKDGGRYLLEGRAWGEKFDLKKHGSSTDIKAVTYHRMEINQLPDGKWQGRVMFDI